MMNEMEQKFVEKVDTYYDDMVETLKSMVNIDSGEDNPEGIEQVAHIIGDFLKNIHFQVEYLEYPGICTHVKATRRSANPDAKEVMIIGHMDTVFPKGTAADRPFTIEGEKAYGPGVLDMKSGITIALYALKAMDELDLYHNHVTVMFAGDEEPGHPRTDAKALFKAEAKNKNAVFNMETGADNGSVVVGRKAIFYPIIDVEGIAAHSGKDPQKGASAILELMKKIEDCYAFAAADDDITFNCGIIKGGIVANGIPAHAQMQGDFRWSKVESGPKIIEAMKEICAKKYDPRTTTTYVMDPNRGFTFPLEPDEKVMKLFDVVHAQGEKIGVDIQPIRVGAGADSNATYEAGAPSVCAMGGRGELNHSAQEYLWLYSLTERAKILGLSVMAVK